MRISHPEYPLNNYIAEGRGTKWQTVSQNYSQIFKFSLICLYKEIYLLGHVDSGPFVPPKSIPQVLPKAISIYYVVPVIPMIIIVLIMRQKVRMSLHFFLRNQSCILSTTYKIIAYCTYYCRIHASLVCSQFFVIRERWQNDISDYCKTWRKERGDDITNQGNSRNSREGKIFSRVSGGCKYNFKKYW